MGHYRNAIALHEENKKVAGEVGDRTDVGKACGNLENSYMSTGQYGKAIDLHEEDKKIAEEAGDRTDVGKACGNLGNCYESMGQYGKAIELHEEDKKIAEEVGNRAGVGRICGYLCRSYAQDGKFDQSLTYCNQCYEFAWPSVRRGGMRCSSYLLVSVGGQEWQSGGGGEMAAHRPRGRVVSYAPAAGSCRL
jgi:tetratricopeptide (TPR) repeat protein